MAKFIYTGIHVSNLEHAIKFYTQELGMKLLFTSNIKETGGRVAWLKTEGSEQVLELNWYPPNYELGGDSGLDHLAFQVENVDSIYSKLAKKNESGLSPFDEGSWRLAYIKDPDGNWIELGEKFKKPKKRRAPRKKQT